MTAIGNARPSVSAPPIPERKAVLVSGASSGIGEATAIALTQRGFKVFAGVRNPADAARLESSLGPRCTSLLLDVTDATSIAAAGRTIQKSAAGLYGLVNNAGIAVAAPLEFIPLDALRYQFEVNVVGAVALTQTMLPLLRRSLGRVVNVGSIAGRTPLPIAGAYGASKAALDLLSASLRMELAAFDVAVSYIEPGAHRTPIWETSRRSAALLGARLPPATIAYYGALLHAMQRLAAAAERDGDDPARVAAAIVRAFEARSPRTRYTVGRDTRMRYVLRLLPVQLREQLILRRLGIIAHA